MIDRAVATEAQTKVVNVAFDEAIRTPSHMDTVVDPAQITGMLVTGMLVTGMLVTGMAPKPTGTPVTGILVMGMAPKVTGQEDTAHRTTPITAACHITAATAADLRITVLTPVEIAAPNRTALTALHVAGTRPIEVPTDDAKVDPIRARSATARTEKAHVPSATARMEKAHVQSVTAKTEKAHARSVIVRTEKTHVRTVAARAGRVTAESLNSIRVTMAASMDGAPTAVGTTATDRAHPG